MTPGRELDALVAEKVMGCKVLWQKATVSGPYCGCNCADGFEEGPHSDPNRMDANLKSYSTDIAAAWEVVEKLAENGKLLELYAGGGPKGASWTATFFDGSSGNEYADTAPHAICLAALKAVGVDLPPLER